MDFLKKHYTLLLIILVAAIIRLIALSSNPVGFNDDEAAFGYNSYSILKTGKDEWSRGFPFPAFESFGDWKLDVYLILTIISESVLGLNEFATRFPSAAVGIMAVFATYLLTTKIFDKKTALIAALLLAISPWHITASRNAFESDLLVFIISLAAFLFLKSLEKRKYFFLSIILFGLGLYTYRSAWIFVPIFLTFLIYKNKNHFEQRKSLILKTIILFAILIIPLIPTIMSFSGQSRFLQESFITGTTRTGINNEINEKRGVCQNNLPNFICSLTYNKYIALGSAYVNSYITNLSIQTYFDKANQTGFQSFSHRSLFYFFELPILLLGIFLVAVKKNKHANLLLAWLIIAPIAASVTGVANFGRLNLIMPAPQIIEAFAIVFIYSKIKNASLRKTFIVISTALILFCLVKFIIDNFYIEPFYNSRYQRYGYKSLFNYLNTQQDNFSKILISKKIDNSHQYIQYAFFQKVDPVYFQENAKRHHENGWIVFDSIGKYYFSPAVPDIKALEPNILIVAAESEIDGPAAIHLIRDVRGDILFKIYNSDDLINYAKLHPRNEK